MIRLIDGYRSVNGLVPGVVSHVDAETALVQMADGQSAALDIKAVEWARSYIDDSRRGGTPKQIGEVLKPGDIVRVLRDQEGAWKLGQIPAVQGALVGLDPDDGAIRSMIGGFNFSRSKYNRATQSSRSAGSSFKPFIYSAAFDHGFTPASVINDAPLVFPDVSRPDGLWTPSNDDGKFDGPIRLREALVRSRISSRCACSMPSACTTRTSMSPASALPPSRSPRTCRWRSAPRLFHRCPWHAAMR